MPNQPYQRGNKGKFAYLGIDLKHPPDLMPQGRCPYLLNVTPNETQGALQPRAGLTQIADTASGQPIHSIARINNYQIASSVLWSRFVGAADKLYAGQSGTLTQIDSGFSGSALYMIPYRPPQSSETWMYVFDNSKQVKYRVDGTKQNIGVQPPLRAPTATLAPPNQQTISGGAWSPQYSAGAVSSIERVTPATTIGSIRYDTGTSGWANIIPNNGAANYQMFNVGMRIVLTGNAEVVTVWQLYPALPSTTIKGVYVDASGIATIVPTVPVLSVRRDGLVQVNGVAQKVISVTEGPENGYSFRCTTTGVTPAIGQTLAFPVNFRVWTGSTHAAAEVITSPAYQSVMTVASGSTGKGVIFNTSFIGMPLDCTTVNSRSITDDDYFHASLYIDNPSNVAEVHFMFDVDSTTQDFAHNYYYYVVRQNDFQYVATGAQSAVTGLLGAITTQIANTYPVEKSPIQSAQTPYPSASTPQFGVPVSDQYSAGNGQWFELMIKVKDLTRVGSDRSVSLSKLKGYAILAELTGTATVAIGSSWFGGTYGPDCNFNSYGNQGLPILYRYRYRSSLTGAFSEVSPAMRSGILSMRQGVMLDVVASTDTQVDLIDIERNGGTFSGWHRCLVVPNTTASILDDVQETVAMAGLGLELQHYQPWPVTDKVRSGTCSIVGNHVTWLTGDQFDTRWIRGVEVIVNQQTYTLFAPPYSATEIELAQNVGYFPNVKFIIPEATIAGKQLRFVCEGMDGRLFATGDPYNPGNLYFSWPYVPESVSDQGYIEITSPTEPLGPPVYFEGAIYVFSNKSAFRVEPTPDGANPYAVVKLGTVVGQDMPLAIDGSGPAIFYRGPDGIYGFATGSSMNLTGDDLYPLLPFESRPGLPVVVAGQQINPPDDGHPEFQRISFADDMVFYDFKDTFSQFRTLAYTLSTKGWVPYVYSHPICIHYREQGVSDALTLCGGSNGVLYAVYSSLFDHDVTFPVMVVTAADDQGDTRATKQYGDVMLDAEISVSGTAVIQAQVWYDNFILQDPSTNVTVTAARDQYILGADTDQPHRNIGMTFSALSNTGIVLYEWQPSYTIQPEEQGTGVGGGAEGRPTDWMDAGALHYKFVHGCRILGDTGGQPVQLRIEYDGGIIGPTVTFNSNGQGVVPVSFPPFKAHLMRLVPVGGTGTFRLWATEWEVDIEPEPTSFWVTQPTSWDMPGYLHIRDFQFAYATPNDGGVLTLIVDGRTYTLATLPNTQGQEVKLYFATPPVKGKLWSLSGTGTNLQIYRKDCEFRVKPWGAQQYQVIRSIGDENRTSSGAPI